jgi:DNA processing protein
MDDIKIIKKKDFPLQLKEIRRCPAQLYARGNLELLNTNGIAVVGTRANTPYGKVNAINFTRGLVSYGLTIISGLAFGIDAIAHEVALEYGGNTIAILGNGIDQIFPKYNESLGREILKKGGLILSEYGENTKYQTRHYPARNRLIAGLAMATLVIEAPKKSGALITARRAFEENRDVFAVPGDLTREKNKGNLNLIADNIARLVRSPEDILGHLSRQPRLSLEPLEDPLSLTPTFDTPAQKKVWEVISGEPLHTDDILHQSELSVVDVNVALSYLELRGLIRRVGYGRFVRNG